MADIDDDGLRPCDQPDDAVRPSNQSVPLTSALAIDDENDGPLTSPLASMIDSTHENTHRRLSPSSGSLTTTTEHGGDSPLRVSTETTDDPHPAEHHESRKRRSNDVRHTSFNMLNVRN